MTQTIQKTNKATIQTLLESDRFKQAVAKALPKHVTPDRFVRVALTAALKTPKLLECSQESLFNSLMTLSQFGLEPDGRNAHLIPYGNQCQLIIDYKGLVALAMRSGNVSFIHADTVCENDIFVYSKGELKEHTIDFKKPRGEVYAVYSLVRNKDGTETCQVMTRAEVEAIRARSKAKDNGPWKTDWNQMALKTVFRRHSKWLELSPEFRDALEADSDKLEDDRFKAAKPAIVAREESFLPSPTETINTFDCPEDLSTAQGTDVPAEPPPEKEPPVKEAPKVSHDELANQLQNILNENQIEPDAFFKWLDGSGLMPNSDSVSVLMDIPVSVLKRIVASKVGLVQQIKGGLK